MEYVPRHPHPPHTSFDGGDLDCGSGLLLLLRKNIDPLTPGQLLEVRSREPSVEEDLPSWCRLTGNDLVSCVRDGAQWSYVICKGRWTGEEAPSPPAPLSRRGEGGIAPLSPGGRGAGGEGEPFPALTPIAPLSVMGIGSWPRPRWLLQALHDRLEGRLAPEAFQETADDAVRLAVAAQLRAGVDVVTDGEQRRDNYASFVGALLDGCQLIPVTDLLPYVDDPQKFAAELQALDVPADRVRHPAVFGPIRRRCPLAVGELAFVRTLTDRPVKVALPGPYLLTRTMWLECVSDKAYVSRESLAEDVVRVLREEVIDLLRSGAALVQLDEPVLTEVVFSRPRGGRTFMCGALGDKRPAAEELAFAVDLIGCVVAGLPRERLALHVCRGNWSRDERVALQGDYRPLLSVLQRVPVGVLFLELCTPRAGELEVLRDLPAECRVGVGVVNQKRAEVESVEEILAKAEAAVRLFGPERVLLNPDCGFATFADSPVSAPQIAEQKLAAIRQAADVLRGKN